MNILYKSNPEVIELLNKFELKNTLLVIDKDDMKNYSFDVPHLDIDINLIGIGIPDVKNFEYKEISSKSFMVSSREFTTLVYFNRLNSLMHKNIIFLISSITKEIKNAWLYYLRKDSKENYIIPNMLFLYEKITSEISEADFQFFAGIHSNDINEVFTHLASLYEQRETIDYSLIAYHYNILPINDQSTEYIFNEEIDTEIDLSDFENFLEVYHLNDEEKNKLREYFFQNKLCDGIENLKKKYLIFSKNLKLLHKNFPEKNNYKLFLKNNFLIAEIEENKTVYFINSVSYFNNFRPKFAFDREEIIKNNAYQILQKIIIAYKHVYEHNGIRLKNFIQTGSAQSTVEMENDFRPNDLRSLYDKYLLKGFHGKQNKSDVQFEFLLEIPNLLEGGALSYKGIGMSKKIAKNNAALYFIEYFMQRGLITHNYNFTHKIFECLFKFYREIFDSEIKYKNSVIFSCDDVKNIIDIFDEAYKEEFLRNIQNSNITNEMLTKYFTVRSIHFQSIKKTHLTEIVFIERREVKNEGEKIFAPFTSVMHLFYNKEYSNSSICTDEFDEHRHILAIGLSERPAIETSSIVYLGAYGLSEEQLSYLSIFSSMVFNYQKNTEIKFNSAPSENYLIVPVMLSDVATIEYHDIFGLCNNENNAELHGSSIFSYSKKYMIDLFHGHIIKTARAIEKTDIINFEKFAMKIYSALNIPMDEKSKPVYSMEEFRKSGDTEMIMQCELLSSSQYYTLKNFLEYFNIEPLSKQNYENLLSTISSIFFAYKTSLFIKQENLIIEGVEKEEKRKRKPKGKFFKSKGNLPKKNENVPEEKVFNFDSKQLLDLLSLSFNLISDGNKGKSYDQLEFIGDCVLKFNISTELCKNFLCILNSMRSSKFKFSTYIKEMTGLSIEEQNKILNQNSVENLNPLSILISLKSYFISNFIFRDYAHNMKLTDYIRNSNFLKQPIFHSYCVKNKEHNIEVSEEDCLHKYITKIVEQTGNKINGNLNKKIGFHIKKDGKNSKITLPIGKKELSDVYEAVVGSYFLIGGLPMLNRNIFTKNFYGKRSEEIQQFILFYFSDRLKDIFQKEFSLNDQFSICPLNYAKLFSFNDIFKFGELQAVEKIFGYRFTNKSYLESALLHPSYNWEKNFDLNDSVKIFSRNSPFELLEFLGDSVIDLYVMEMLYMRGAYPYSNGSIDLRSIPCEDLHLYKAKHVCNINLARILVKLDLHKYFKSCMTAEEIELCMKMNISDRSSIFNNYTKLFEDEEIEEIVREKDSNDGEQIKKKALKKFGDMFEALIGAVFIDCDFDYAKLKDSIPNVLNAILK